MADAIPFGNYELIERIAEGGMAEVWRARSRGVAGFEKTVVIKRVLPTLLARPGFAELLVREAKIAARLNHPNIVQIYDLGEFEASYFIAMEYLEGRDLAAALGHRTTTESPLSLPLRLWIGAETAKALDYAHRVRASDGKPLSIVHRDISPQNVLLGYEGEVKVADFGIARADSAGLGRGEDPSILRGKYAYMSPEQARGEPLDRRSDIFSFGILLYELATRRRMFRSTAPNEILEQVRAAQLPEYEERVPLPELVPILQRALAAEPADRYDSAAEMHAALSAIVFNLGKPVGQTDLAAAMHRMFPPSGDEDPNKLRVDLLLRAQDDAAGTLTANEVVPSRSGSARTFAMPKASTRKELRRMTFLAIQPRHGDRALFERKVEQSGGSVLLERGDMLIAAFGLSRMERAVGHAARCALEMRRASRLEGTARLERVPPMALASAAVRVSSDGSTSLGDKVVERLERLMPSRGEIRIEAVLCRELARDFQFHEHDGHVTLDGYRSRREREAGAMRRGAPLIGRRNLLRTLSGMLLDTARGTGQVVHLVGEPGVGKSRLLAEMRAAAAPRDFAFVHGRAREADADGSFGALIDLVEDLCGIEPEDAPGQRFEKVERLQVLGLSPGAVRMVGERLGLAYPLPANRRLGRPRGIQLALSIRAALRRLAEDRVVVLALEDLHWMDDATRQVLPLLIDGITNERRIFVLVTRRPGHAGRLSASGSTLEVEPLDREATGRLIAHHIAARAVEPELAELVHHDTGGIPAWIELMAEPIRPSLVVEDHVARLSSAPPETIPLPPSVRSLVAARIQRLRARDRSMLRVAAAMSGTVEVRALSAIEGLIGNSERTPLRRLLIRRLLTSADAEPFAPERLGAWGGDEGDERLPHAVHLRSELLRRAVLAEMGEGELARLHGRIATTLERMGTGASTEGLWRLADHAAASVDPRRAPDFFIAAAERSVADGDSLRAAAGYVRAAELIRTARSDPADTQAFELGLRAAEVALRAGALELAGDALAPLEVAGDRVEAELAVRRAVVRAQHARRSLRSSDAVEAVLEIEPLLDDVSVALRVEARDVLGWALLEDGHPDRAIEVFSEAAETEELLGMGRALAARAVASAQADRLDEAEDDMSSALELAAREGEIGLRFASLVARATVAEARGEPSAARFREAAEVGLEAGRRHGVSELFALAATSALAAGDDTEAAKRAEDASRLATQLRQRTWVVVATAIRSAIAIRAHPESTYVPRIVRVVDELAPKRPREAALALEMLAYAHLVLDDVGAAKRTLSRASDLAERAGHRSYARRLTVRAEEL